MAELADELTVRLPLELLVPNDISFYDLQRAVKDKLAEADLVPRSDPMSMRLALNGQVCDDPVASPLLMLVPGSVVSLVDDVAEAHEVSRLGLCLNAVQLKKVQWARPEPNQPLTEAQKPLSEEVLRERRAKLYKTVLCANFTGPVGYCAFGKKCHFAHGIGELRVLGLDVTAQAGQRSAEEAEKADDWQWKDWDSKWKSSDWKGWSDWDSAWGGWSSKWRSGQEDADSEPEAHAEHGREGQEDAGEAVRASIQPEREERDSMDREDMQTTKGERMERPSTERMERPNGRERPERVPRGEERMERRDRERSERSSGYRSKRMGRSGRASERRRSAPRRRSEHGSRRRHRSSGRRRNSRSRRR